MRAVFSPIESSLDHYLTNASALLPHASRYRVERPLLIRAAGAFAAGSEATADAAVEARQPCAALGADSERTASTLAVPTQTARPGFEPPAS